MGLLPVGGLTENRLGSQELIAVLLPDLRLSHLRDLDNFLLLIGHDKRPRREVQESNMNVYQ